MTDGLNSVQSLMDNWPAVLELIAHKLGGPTAGLLGAAVPKRFENGTLSLEFPASAKMQKQMCESNGRVEQVRTLLSEQFSTPLTLNFELAEAPAEVKPAVKHGKTFAQKRNELINDPAVKTVLLGLDATVTGIDEDQS